MLVDRAMQWLEDVLPGHSLTWAEEAILFSAKVVATAVLLPFSLWLPGPELLVARIWARDLEDS